MTLPTELLEESPYFFCNHSAAIAQPSAEVMVIHTSSNSAPHSTLRSFSDVGSLSHMYVPLSTHVVVVMVVVVASGSVVTVVVVVFVVVCVVAGQQLIICRAMCLGCGRKQARDKDGGGRYPQQVRSYT